MHLPDCSIDPTEPCTNYDNFDWPVFVNRCNRQFEGDFCL